MLRRIVSVRFNNKHCDDFMLDSKPLLIDTDFPPIRRAKLHTLQVNLGYLCNLSCTHCHVNAGPRRTELMSRELVDLVLECVIKHRVQTLDLTGGAPEMNPEFRYLVRAARKLGVEVIDRCNLTILRQPGFEGLAEFLAEQQVRIVASLPCYLEENVDGQRGKGVFTDSIEALKQLNQLGYGRELSLDLVYNPTGPFLPPPQQVLEQTYKAELHRRYGITFNTLLTITNMPIMRFGSVLQSQGQFASYMQLLKDNYCAQNLGAVMCRELISIDWQGWLYDCDFNQMLSIPLIAGSKRRHLRDLLTEDFMQNPIAIADHCYGCTAGQGSSCGGALES